MRQQTRNNARGSVVPVTLPRQDMAWEVIGVAGAVVLLSVPGFDGQLVIGPGVLTATCPEAASEAIASTIVGNTVEVTFPSALPAPSTIIIKGNDPAVRNDSGGYLAPGTSIAVPVPPQVVYATAASDTQMTAAYTQATSGGSFALFLPIAGLDGTQRLGAVSPSLGSAIDVRDQASTVIATMSPGQVWLFQVSLGSWLPTQVV